MLNDVASPPPPPPEADEPPPPRFPTYLLPSLSRPFRRHRRISSPSSAAAPAHSDVPSLSNSPTDSVLSSPVDCPPASSPHSSWLSHVKEGFHRPSTKQHDAPKLTRIRPDTIRCSTCGTDFAFYSQVVSKGFTGRYGRAYLVSPPGGPSQKSGADLMNIKLGKPEPRNLVTGAHVVSDIQCATCRAKIGWKYVDAKEESQKYKIGKFILETKRTVDYASWEDAVADETPELEFEQKGTCDDDDAESVVFDSDDEDECEDLFAGVWDAKTAAKRRKLKLGRRGK
ncbi:yippee zinc-binding/DNA-binding /Mis18, centromere assembly-domain-containing protein [Xylaria sp. FL1042]|nr:yippee zinc-binding/DNA-binding /Mis18, centromere assembly-domain-containing protein [Xylaria sp. FL1042]